jgi:hypothetical protein
MSLFAIETHVPVHVPRSDIAVAPVRVPQRRPFKGRNRDTILGLLALMQGGKCFYQFPLLEDGRPCCNGILTVIAHKNHLPFDDRPENLAASCDPCNKHINDLARGKIQSYVKERMSVREPGVHAPLPGKQTASEQKHETAWPKFVDYSKEVLGVSDEFPYEDFVRNAAKLSGVSIDTIEDRYIRKEDCLRGFLKVFRKGRGGPKLIQLNRELVEEDYKP